MTNFEQRLQELGLQESELSVACKNLIDDYRSGIAGLPMLEAENEGGELDNDIETLQEELEELDKKIVSKINWYHKNKDKIESGESKGLRGRPKKNPTPIETSNPTPTATATITAPAKPAQNQNTNQTTNTDPKPKKGFGFGTLLLVLGGAILGVSLLNRD